MTLFLVHWECHLTSGQIHITKHANVPSKVFKILCRQSTRRTFVPIESVAHDAPATISKFCGACHMSSPPPERSYLPRSHSSVPQSTAVRYADTRCGRAPKRTLEPGSP